MTPRRRNTSSLGKVEGLSAADDGGKNTCQRHTLQVITFPRDDGTPKRFNGIFIFVH